MSMVFDNGKSASLDLSEKAHEAFTIASLFGGVPQPDMGSGYATNAGEVGGIFLFGEVDLQQLAGLALDDGLATEIVFPHVASDDYWWTGIALHNPNAGSAQVEFVCYNSQGQAIGTMQNTVDAHSTLVNTAAGFGLPAETAWFKATSSLPVTGFELFGVQDQDRLAGVNLVNIAAASGDLANIQKDGWTGLVFVNPSSTPAAVTLEARDDNGSLIARETLNLGAMGKLSSLVQELFEDDVASATHVRFSADREITAFQLNGLANPDRIEGIPALGSNLTKSDTRILFPHIAVD